MDLLFKRYASPFIFVDGMMQSGRFSEFVDEFVHTINSENEEQVNWDFYLHKVSEGSFSDFVDELKQNKENQKMTASTIESTVQQSMDILNNFSPKGGET
jgi:hypothetical protein